MSAEFIKKNSRIIGADAEDLAASYLAKLGFRIEERNFYVHMIGEIDIIASRNDSLYFVEVKCRTNRNTFDIPNGCVSYKKLKRIRNCAEVYLQRKNIDNKYCKFVGAIIHNTESEKIPEIKLIPFEWSRMKGITDVLY